MDFSVISQIRTKKFWWMDVIFYFMVSLLISTLLCYLIFLIKNNIQRQDIKKEIVALQTVGTDQQKDHEKQVVTYQSKIRDFSSLLQNHEFASNVFAFIQAQTLPNAWFSQLVLDEKNSTVQLSGESDDFDAFSRQVASFEKNKYVKSIATMNSLLGQSAKIEFNINLLLDQDIFSYLSSLALALQTQHVLTQEDQTPPAVQENQAAPGSRVDAGAQGQTPGTQSSESLITSFHLLLNPEVIGAIDQTNHNIVLNVPYDTDIKTLTPSVVVSPGATLSPEPDVLQDFTNPVTYIVTAQDGSAQTYTATVLVGSQVQVAKKAKQQGFGVLIISILAAVVAAVVAALFFIWRKKIRGTFQQRINEKNKF